MANMAKLYHMQLLLYNNRRFGLTEEQIAEDCGVSVKQIKRDLTDLELIVGVPVEDAGNGRLRVKKGHFLPPVHLNLPEVMGFFLAARLLLSHSNVYDPNIESTFSKLIAAVDSPLHEEIKSTIDWMKKLPMNETLLRTMVALTKAWMNRQSVIISYKRPEDDKPTERKIDPYFIQPYAAGHSSYIIAYCHRADDLRVFHISRIADVRSTDESYDVPSDFDANEYLATAWGIVNLDEAVDVKLKFNPAIARVIEGVRWHTSQVTELQADGYMIMKLKVSLSDDFVGWILNWGEKVEVLEPEELRPEILETAKAMVNLYSSK